MVYRYSKPPTQRQLRVSQSIKEALSEIFMRNELSIPELESLFITISEVRISPDLKLATAFVSTIVVVEPEELVAYLNSLGVRIRPLISKRVALKFVPQIRFAYDKSFDEGARMDALLASSKKD